MIPLSFPDVLVFPFSHCAENDFLRNESVVISFHCAESDFLRNEFIFIAHNENDSSAPTPGEEAGRQKAGRGRWIRDAWARGTRHCIGIHENHEYIQ